MKREKAMDLVEGQKHSKKIGEDSPIHQGRYEMNSAEVWFQVCSKVLRKLEEAGNEVVQTPGFVEDLKAHFKRLPERYAFEVNLERAEDVLTHKNLLKLAKSPENRPVFDVRTVNVRPISDTGGGPTGTMHDDHWVSGSAMQGEFDGMSGRPSKINVFPPPSFGPPQKDNDTEDIGPPQSSRENQGYIPMHQVCFSTIDKPKLLSQLSALLADVGLNIREAHAFSTNDGYSLDVFVVDGWPTEDTKGVKEELQRLIANMEEGAWVRPIVSSPKASPPQPPQKAASPPLSQPSAKIDNGNDWEIDSRLLKRGQKVASGAFGDLYRGTYCGQDVAIKVLKQDRIHENLQHEFQQEIYIMRKIRHKNVVQFIGACTKEPDNLSIVTEFMSGGSVYDYLHKQKVLWKLPVVIRVALDISKGMDYLHQYNIIHRDLKAANLLMDENEVVKVADFGVARVQDQRGIMTAETGTYRWMAPEVIEHKTYDRKVDVFSFGIVLWELLTGKLPYADLTPLQAAVGVVQKGLRPTIPKNTNPKIVDLLERCWKTDPTLRPEFSEITVILQDIFKEVGDDGHKKGEKKGFLSAMKRTAGNR